MSHPTNARMIAAFGMGAAGTATGAFSPTDISDLVAWFDPSDTGTITKDGSNLVSQMDDKSGNANHATQSTDANKPLDSGQTQNGKRVLQYNRSSDNGIHLDLPLNLARNRPGFTVSAVVRRDTTSARMAFGFSASGGSGTTLFRGEQQSSWYVAGRRLDSDSFVEINGGDTTTANWHVVTWLVDWQNTLLQVYANGTLAAEDTSFQTSGNSEDADHADAALGAGQNGSVSWRDQQAEVCMYAKALSGTERGNLETYLADGWGVTI